MNDRLLFFLLTSSFIVAENVGVIDLVIEKRNSFPYPTNKSFSIYVTRKNGPGKISSSVRDTMVIIIRDDGGQVLSRAIYDYGFKDQIDQPYKSDYVTIQVWAKNFENDAINVSMLFSRQANDKWLELYQLPDLTSSQRTQMLKDVNHGRLLLRERLNLLVPPQLRLTVVSPHDRESEFMVGEVGTARCRATDGVPVVAPRFVGLEHLSLHGDTFDEETNERTARFVVSLADHGRLLRCVAGDSEASSVVRVMHHPRGVVVAPEPGRSLANGSSLACLAKDGYPPPAVRWTLVNGPTNASRFFVIEDQGATFRLMKDAPEQSRWTINCSATNIVGLSSAVQTRSISFVVARPTEDLTSQIIIGVAVVAAIVLFSVMMVVAVCIIRRCCLRYESVNNSRKNGAAAKTLTKEKDVEAEPNVPLLPSGHDHCPEVDKSGSEMALGPPAYDQITIEVVNPVDKCDDDNDGDVHDQGSLPINEPEINCTDLPATGALISDQVVYPQRSSDTQEPQII